MPSINGAKKFVSHKQLSAAFGMDPQTLKRDIKKLKGITLERYQHYYPPKQLEVIYRAFGNPFEQ